jgi:AbrB family looped-hinge helix DNA binding protein
MMVTTKGQVTIPQEIREHNGFLPHTEVEFVEINNQVVLRKANGRGRSRKILECMSGAATSGMSTDQIMALTRDDSK